MPSSASLLRAVRLTHRYIGVFISPALLFFAFTGAVQTFSLHETTKGSDYKPSQILVTLGQIHKKQTPTVPARKPQPPGEVTAPKPDQGARGPNLPAASPNPPGQHNPLPLKIFFLLVSIGLFSSTLTGVYMCYKFDPSEGRITVLLLLGIAIPVLMIVL